MAVGYVIPPAGVSAASFFDPGVTFVDPAESPALLSDAIDVLSGELLGLFDAPHPVDAAIRTAFRVAKASGAAARNIGHQFKQGKKTDRTERELKDEATRVLSPFVTAGDIKVMAMTVNVDSDSVGADGAALRIDYYNRQSRSHVEGFRP